MVWFIISFLEIVRTQENYIGFLQFESNFRTSLMSRNARKYCLQSSSCPTGLLDIFIYFMFDIILCVLVEFH